MIVLNLSIRKDQVGDEKEQLLEENQRKKKKEAKDVKQVWKKKNERKNENNKTRYNKPDEISEE